MCTHGLYRDYRVGNRLAHFLNNLIFFSIFPFWCCDDTFALAQERLEANKTHAPRRTVVPSVVQGLVSCANCGYALYRTSTRSSARTIYYITIVVSVPMPGAGSADR